jgi:hypothetical protein
MTAKQGDRITIHGRTVGAGDRHGEIVEVRGEKGAPPYAVKFDDGHDEPSAAELVLNTAKLRLKCQEDVPAVTDGW